MAENKSVSSDKVTLPAGSVMCVECEDIPAVREDGTGGLGKFCASIPQPAGKLPQFFYGFSRVKFKAGERIPFPIQLKVISAFALVPQQQQGKGK